jgi:hypothetical protein
VLKYGNKVRNLSFRWWKFTCIGKNRCHIETHRTTTRSNSAKVAILESRCVSIWYVSVSKRKAHWPRVRNRSQRRAWCGAGPSRSKEFHGLVSQVTSLWSHGVRKSGSVRLNTSDKPEDARLTIIVQHSVASFTLD